MATKVILPKLGQTMEEGTIVEWAKAEGDPVNRGDVLFSLESDKAVLEVEARSKGVLRKILLGPGVKVPVMTVVGVIAEPDEDIRDILAEVQGEGAPEGQQPPAAPPQAAPATAQAEAPETRAATAPQPIERPSGRLFASPRARKLAEEQGVDLDYVAGSGPNGRIIEKDVVAYMQAQPAATPLARKLAAEQGLPLAGLAAPGERVRTAQVMATVTPAAAASAAIPPSGPPPMGEITPMRGVRAIIAERMGTSAHTTAAVTLQSVVDATAFVHVRTLLRDALAEELGFSVGYNDLLAVIVARCLVEFPYMNVRLEEGGIRHLETVNLGMAVDNERGLLVPVIHDAQTLGVKEFARRFRELVDRARQGKSLPDDLTGGTFTITNLGMFGVDMFTPIINLPECAILGVGRIRPEPVAIGGEVVVRERMWLSLTFDHRLVDGAPAARFLQGIVRYIESPYLLLA
ncbi:MAG: 2-oxo acid dehydrogenase subunit E2 [Anaerolineae bacterium]|nr:2-oxo acid dehydrogenase subunit E2 [Anaerolineae bacterium]